MSDECKMYLEALCNELLLEIFEYLDAYKLFTTFFGLNRRFNDLIRQCHLHICIDHPRNDGNIWDLIASTIDLTHVREISYYCIHFIDRRFLISLCPNVRSVTLYKVNGFFLQVILNDIPFVNQIKNIRIEYPKLLCDSNELSCRDFTLKTYCRQLTSLVTCSVDIPLNFYLPSDNPIFPKLRRISLDEGYWRTNTIEFIQNSLPNLRSLYIRTFAYTPYQSPFSKYILKNIFELDINLNFDSINIGYLVTMFPCLRKLNIQWDTYRKCPFIDGFQWQKIMEKHWSLLRHLTFNFQYSNVNEQFLNTFYKNKYWISKIIYPTVWKPCPSSNQILKICF